METVMAKSVVMNPFLMMVLLFIFPLSNLAAGSNDPSMAYADRKNPISELTERDKKYFAKQYKTKCSRCHGKEGDGKAKKSKREGPKAVAFTDSKYMNSITDGQDFYQIEQ